MSEKLFSIQDVVNITAKMLQLQPKDLIDSIKENDLSTVDLAINHLQEFSNSKFRNLHKEGVNTGFRRSAEKLEKLYSEIFGEKPTTENLDDLISDFKAKNKPVENNPTTITLKDALKVKEISDAFNALKLQAAESEKTKNDFENFKNVLGLKNKAIEQLKNLNLKFSDVKGIAELQEAKLETILSQVKHKIENDGSVTLLEQDGTPLFNSKKASTGYLFSDYIMDNASSFLDSQTNKQTDKPATPYTPPNGQNQNNSTFGFVDNHVFTADDYRTADNAKESQKAAYILSKLTKE